MHAFKNMKPLNTMERISRQRLCDDFDNILERIDKENIGFVIVDDQGKDKHVLCPAHWMYNCFDDDFGCIVNSALRYAICRNTYMPSTVVDFIRRHINILNKKTIDVAIKDIESELNRNNVPEPEMWSALKVELEARLAYLCEKEATIENQLE